MDEALFFKELNNAIYIKARGHITAALCAELKTRVFERLEAQPAVINVFIDLSECVYMDSTFMGLLVGFNKRFLRFSQKPITILRAGQSCMQLLKTIGILRLVILSDETVAFPTVMENLVSSEKTTVEFLLDVHQNLMEISEENKKRFSTLQNVLKSQKDSESEK